MSRGFLNSRTSRGRLRIVIGAVAVAIAPMLGEAAQAQSMSVTGSPGSMAITTAIAGSAPIGVSETTSRYSTNTLLVVLNKCRISARLNSALPAGATLTIQLAAQSGATSLGEVTLSTTAQSVVTDIPALSSASNLVITYRLNATSAAGTISASSRTVTLTISTQ